MVDREQGLAFAHFRADGLHHNLINKTIQPGLHMEDSGLVEAEAGNRASGFPERNPPCDRILQPHQTFLPRSDQNRVVVRGRLFRLNFYECHIALRAVSMVIGPDRWMHGAHVPRGHVWDRTGTDSAALITEPGASQDHADKQNPELSRSHDCT